MVDAWSDTGAAYEFGAVDYEDLDMPRTIYATPSDRERADGGKFLKVVSRDWAD